MCGEISMRAQCKTGNENSTKQKNKIKLTDPELSIDVCWGRTFVLRVDQLKR
jgi:hypothetical protein